MIPTSPGCPPGVQTEVDAFLTSQDYWDMLADFTERNGLEALASTDDPPVGEVTEDEMVSLTSYFNVVQHNGLLRVAYSEFNEIIPYLEIVLYDMGTSVTDQEEYAAIEDAFFDFDTDCMKLTREMVSDFLYANFAFTDMGMDDFNACWDEMKERMLYLEEYDAFYLIHGDTMMAGYDFDRAERNSDGTVNLYYTTDLWYYNDSGELDLLWDQPMCARLVPSGDLGWTMISNTIIE